MASQSQSPTPAAPAPAPPSPTTEEPTSKKQKRNPIHTPLNSNFPSFLPSDPWLHLSPEEFEKTISASLPSSTGVESDFVDLDIVSHDDDHDNNIDERKESAPSTTDTDMHEVSTTGNAFVDALDRAAKGDVSSKHLTDEELAARNRTRTEKGGVTFKSTLSPLLDLFNKIDTNDDDDDSGSDDDDDDEDDQEALAKCLKEAWAVDSLTTLKIIFLSRSIHLGRGERGLFYKQLAWLGEKHPRTLLGNLEWVVRRIVRKDAKGGKEGEGVVVQKVGDGDGDGEGMVDDYDVVNGVAHGYWKDLLNILVLSAEAKLDMSDPDQMLKQDVRPAANAQAEKDAASLGEKWSAQKKQSGKEKISNDENTSGQREFFRSKKRQNEANRHEQIQARLSTSPLHRALHLTIARLFATQLRKDMLALESGNPSAIRDLSLCAKWAPSPTRFHDKHTLIATTIAELLYPPTTDISTTDQRTTYLKHAREKYRAHTLSPLRKALHIVERDISANTFSNIQYSRVPSLAMNQYKSLFKKKDGDRFHDYIIDVAAGKATISGAVLTPGQLVKQVIDSPYRENNDMEVAVANVQWKALVQRIKDSGTLSDAIAVCDVSGSMNQPQAKNGTCPLHHSIGLSLLITEVTRAPFGGRVIMFAEDPAVVSIGGDGDERTFTEQVVALDRTDFGYTTDFLKVFNGLVLPLAVENGVSREDMVKRIFVFSDMQFDEARGDGKQEKWETHQEIIQKAFEEKGYKVPELIYWNLAGKPKDGAPVTHDMVGTAMVSGQSQGMMKVFLEGGGFEDADDEEDVEMEMENKGDGAEGGGDEDEWGVVKKKEKTIDPMKIVWKAVGHEAFGMLKVLD
ncbi:hypothetical protein FQN50_007058 [Emmonsiellopsis sp. PD_5]|nr:hypothetical protein FQN50_007058 [Emmonsiellopsis sp. PD_5]